MPVPSLKAGNKPENWITLMVMINLYDAHFKTGEYIDYPRGRVVWDEKKIHSIIYIDPCINRENVLSQIIDAFDIGDYVVEYDDHYHCKNCVGDLFN